MRLVATYQYIERSFLSLKLLRPRGETRGFFVSHALRAKLTKVMNKIKK